MLASAGGRRTRASAAATRSDAGAVGIAVMFEAVSKAWQESELERPDGRLSGRLTNDHEEGW